jgi:hypothetical protein
MSSQFDGLEEQLKAERNKVDVSAINFSTREIVRMYIDGELVIAPSYQRKYRWPKNIASKFIESIFLGLPIPPIFVATNDNFTWEVVDGLQRISTLILYMTDNAQARDKISSSSAPLRLTRLENLSQLNDTVYTDLPRPLQLYLARQPLQVVSLTDKSNKSVRFDLFERLNTGSISLSAQEVRTAVYRGDFLSFIEELAENHDLNRLVKLQEANKNDGTITEQVLKYFAYKNDSSSFKGAVTNFLNEFIVKVENDPSSFDYENERTIFVKTMNYLSRFTDGPFLREGTYVTPLVQFEAAAVGIGQLIQEGKEPSQPPADWLNDRELVTSSTGGSNTRSMLNRRVTRAKDLFSGSVNGE